MKVLYDCFSCSPYYGSDEGIGWRWPYYMRQYHEIWVLIRKDRRADIEEYCEKHNIQDIHFIYCDIPDWMNFYYKNKQKGKNKTLDFLFYQYLWQYVSFKTAKRMHKEIHFDIVHHVCTNDFRILGHMHKLGIPVVIGPVGGAQETPEGLRYYIRKHKKEELLRTLLNNLMTRLPYYRRALDSATKIYFSNCETRDFLHRQIRDAQKCELLTEIGSDGIGNQEKVDKPVNETVFIWAGRMEYRKGLELLIDALKCIPADKKWQLKLCGDGRERQFIQSLCEGEAFKDRVEFLGKLPYETVQELYKEANVFVFPSLRETTGTVILEAMSCGLPVICLRQGGASLMVTEETGYLISVDSREKCIEEFANAMIDCIDHPQKCLQLGRSAIVRVKDSYLWEQKCQRMSKIYSAIADNN